MTARKTNSTLLSFKPSVVQKKNKKKRGPFLVPHYHHSAAEFGLHRAAVTMTMEVAPGRGGACECVWGGEGGGRGGGGGLFQERADREREECDSD